MIKKKVKKTFDLLGIRVSGSRVTVALAVDGGVSATADSIHPPLREVIINDVDITEPASWHALHQTLAEVIKRDCNLHAPIHQVLIIVSKKHHLIMVRKMTIRNSNPSGPHNSIDQAVRAIRQRAMVDPDLPRAKNRNPITVRFASPPYVRWTGSYVGVPGGSAVVDVDVVDDDVGDVLERDAAVAGDVDVGSAAVQGLVAVEYELVF